MEINEITYQIRGAMFDVYNELGPGLLESIYEKALCLELQNRNMNVSTQVPLDVYYKGTNLGLQYRIDLLVEETVIIELKSVEALQPTHFKQLQTYLKLSNKPIGFLVNFNTANLVKNIKRVANCPDNPELNQ